MAVFHFFVFASFANAEAVEEIVATGENQESFVVQDVLESETLEPYFIGPCSHCGVLGAKKMSDDVQGRYLFTITHVKEGLNACDHLMYWKLKFSYYPKDGSAPAVSRTRTDSLAPGRSCVEEICAPLGYTLEVELITEIEGGIGSSSTGILFYEF